MPRYDVYHEPVKHALIKDGWTITDDPFIIEYKGLRLYADLGAEKPIAAEKFGRKIVVEIKVFGAPFKFQLTVLRKPLVVVGWCLHHESLRFITFQHQPEAI